MIGTIIHGTHRPQDLLPSFLDALRAIGEDFKYPDRDTARAEYAQLVAMPFGFIPSHAQEDENADWWRSEECTARLEEISELLFSHAPPFAYFGTLEGDGSDFGFWPDWDQIENAEHDDDLIHVSDLAEVPDDYWGTVLNVNDHGNATLYYVERDGRQSRIWSIV